MKTIRYIQSLLVMLLISMSGHAQDYNELVLKDVNGMRGKVISVPVYLENFSEITSLQFDIKLPGGTGYVVYPDSSKIAENRKADHVISGYNKGSYTTRFMIYSPTNAPLRGNTGKVCDVVFKIPTSLDDTALHDITLSNVIMADKSGNNVFTNSKDSKLSLVSYPDFEVSNLTVTNANITPGGTLTMSWLVKNIGETASMAGWKENFYLVNDDGTSVFIGSNNFDNSGMAPGASLTRNITVNLPSVLGIDGTVKVKVSIKGNSDSGERYEQEWNNTAIAETGIILNRSLSLTLPTTSIPENRGNNIRCQLSRSGNKSAEETFQIAYTNTSRIEMPTSVTIPKNQSSVTFYANIIDNDVYNEDSIVNITASGTGYNSVTGRIVIDDNEYPDLTLTSSREDVNEGESFTLTVTLPKAVSTDTQVSFTSENSKLFDMPSSLIIPSGSKSGSITVNVLQNDLPEVEIATAFFATATKYNKAQCIVVKMDDDMPDLELTISPATVSESAGPVAVNARLVRKTLTDRAVTIVLSDDNDGNVYYSTRRINMAAGVTTAEFTLGTIDNAEVDGTRTVTITAGVYAQSCNCSATGTVTGASSVQLTLLDNDGPTLSVKTSKSSLMEGMNNAAVLTVTRNTGTSGNTVVTLTSDRDSDLTYNHTATINSGSASVQIPISVKSNDMADDERTVLFTASADGFTQGTCFALITDQSIPDATISELTVASEEVVSEGKTDISVTIENVGNQPLPSQTPVKVYLKRDSDRELLTTIFTQAVINAGESGTTTKTVTMPNSAGKFKMYAVANEDKKIHELIYLNNTSQEIPFTIMPSYTATVTTDKSVYNQSENINVTGTLNGNKTANATVEVYFINNNVRTTENVTTDAQGRFTLSYNTKSVGGHYIIGACYPDERLTDAMAEVDVYGLRRSGNDIRKYQPTVGLEWNDELNIINSCPLPQTGITAELLNDKDDISFTFTPVSSISGNQQATLRYSITPTKASTGDQWNTMTVRVKSNEGAFFDFPIYYYNRSPQGKIRADVTRINTTMVKGQSRDYPINITNTGNGPTGKISISMPNTNWLTSVTPLELPSIETTDTTTIILRFTPTDDMPLNVPVTGTIGINCETGEGLPLSFSIEPVSESTGKLIIDVTDEYTYFTDEAPHVEGAKVRISHPTTGRLIAEGDTGSDGLYVLDDIPEGLYSIYVSATNHDSYRNEIMVDPGKDNNKEVFLSIQAISVSWDVVETEVEDVYNIVTTVKYETNVPAPVVTVKGESDLTSIQKLNVGESEIYYYTYTNEGLITAMNFRFTPIGDTEGVSGDFKYEILNTPPMELAPQQQYIAALKITRLTKGEGKRRTPMMKEAGDGTSKKVGCIQYLLAAYEYFCKQMNTRGVTQPLQVDTDCASFLNGYVEGDGTNRGPGTVGTPSGGSNYGGSGGMYGNWGDRNDCPDNSMEKWNACQKLIERAVVAAAKSNPYTRPMVTVWEFCDKTEKTMKEWEDWWKKSKDLTAKGKLNFANFAGTIVLQNPAVKYVEDKVMGFHIPTDQEDANNVLSDVIKNDLEALAKDENVRKAVGNSLDNAGNHFETAKEICEWYNDIKTMDGVMRGNNPVISDHTPAGHHVKNRNEVRRKEHEVTPPCFIVLGDALMLIDCHIANREAIVDEFYGDPIWRESSFKALRTLNFAVYDAIQDDHVDFDELIGSKPENISDEQLQTFINRLNNSLAENDDSNQINYDNLTTYIDNILYLNSYAIGRGYDGIAGMFDAGLKGCEDYAKSTNRGSVCASVTLQFNQTMTMTRQAFRGTLTVENNSSAGEMKDVKLKVEVSDVDGNIATAHEFQINAESLNGFQGEVELGQNWTLAQNEKGVATILFIPTKYAAETEEKVYYFGGSLSYVDPATELTVTRDLQPVSLTVKPSPNLNLTYFMQRDIYGDDAMTKDVFEPIIPAEFALLIENEGYGDATNVKMVTDQPKIIENEKGLFVDFTFASSQLNGQEKVLSLGQSIPTNFGTIPSRGTAYAQWWLECSLLGHFYDYDVQATHVTSYGNEDLSLLNNVTIHELIHSVNTLDVKGEPLKGWLVNDEADTNDYPDILYLSDATTERLNMLRSAEIAWSSANECKLTVIPSDAGWNYGNVVDPTRGRQNIERVIRTDGTNVDLQNVWQTDRTLIDGQEPLYENRIHIADKFTNGGSQEYTIVFSPRPETVLFVEEISGIPTDGEVMMEPIDNVTIKFNKPINQSTLAANIALTCQGKKVEETPTITRIDNQTFKLKWSNATNESGYFTITAYTSRILDQEGYSGEYDFKASWNQIVGSTTMLNIHIVPEDAGTTTPTSGEQTYGEDVTLTATPAYGYNFKQWTFDDEVYSTNATTTYTVESNAMFYAEFEPKKFDVTVDDTELHGSLIGAGTGSYDYKSELKLTAQTMPGYRFVGWNLNGDMVSTTREYTLKIQGPTTIRPVTNESVAPTKRRAPGDSTTTVELIYVPSTTTVTNGYQFVEGWNWFSVNPSDTELLTTAKLLESLGGSVAEIRSGDRVLTYSGGTWSGDLTSLSPGESYQIRLNEAKTLTVDVNTDNISSDIRLSRGWNNVSYLPYESLDINSALNNWDAQKNDIVKSQDAFAIFDGTRWTGTLNTLEPGQGYQFYSQAVTSFSYPVSTTESDVSNIADYAADELSRRFADNMSILAIVSDGEQNISDAKYEVGCFIDGSSAGHSALVGDMYFLTIYGSDGDVISYDIYYTEKDFTFDTPTISTFSSVDNCNTSDPIKIIIDPSTSINDMSADGQNLILRVNTSTKRLYVVNPLNENAMVSIVGMGGNTCISNQVLDYEQSIDVSKLGKGIYVVIVKDFSGEMSGKCMILNE